CNFQNGPAKEVLLTRLVVSGFGSIARILADTGSIRLVGILLFGNTVRTRRPLESVTVVPGSYIAFSRMFRPAKSVPSDRPVSMALRSPLRNASVGRVCMPL